jgi:hypothetical protein
MDKEGHEDDRAFYLEAWTGTSSFTFDRIERGTIHVPSNTLSILGGMTPDVLIRYVREAVRGGGGADGLLQRFQLAVWPDIALSWKNVDRRPDEKAAAKAMEVFKRLDDITAVEVGASLGDGIPFLRFSREAQERFDAWRIELELRLRNGGEHPAFEGHISKYRKLVPALALVLHLANLQTGPVSLEALDMALGWAKYLETHARRIYAAAVRPDVTSARELAKHLKRGELTPAFSLRQLYRKGWAALDIKEDAEAAVEMLCELDWLKRVPRPVSPKSEGGRPEGPIFAVNPKLHSTPTDKTDKS